MLDKLEDLKTKIQATQKLLKIEELKLKLEELGGQMNRPDFWQNRAEAQAIAQDFEDIKTEVKKWHALEQKVSDLIELAKLNNGRGGVTSPTANLPSSNASVDESMNEEITKQTEALQKQFTEYEFFLLLSAPYDQNNAIVSIHAGSGGTEAQDWAEMLLRMIFRFCESRGWKTRLVDESRGAEAGYKSVTFEVVGRYAFGYLKSEHGVHRLVRVSPFDAERMRHTSFALVEVLPELDEKINIAIKPEDLRIDTFMSGGKGGQSVNTTYSAVRIVHIPTGLSVQCQNERSQMQNKDMALKILRAKLHRLEEEKKAAARQELRGEYKSAEWGNQIRSYVLHPYHLVKDHRTDYESTDPEGVLEGKLLPLSEGYLRWIKK